MFRELRSATARAFERAAAPPSSTLERWRGRILDATLLATFIMGAVTAAPSVVLAISLSQWPIVVIDALALGWVAFLALGRSLSFRFRALNLIGLCYVLGTFFLFNVGPVSQIYLMAVPVLSGLLIHLRAALVAVGGAALTLFVCGLLGDADLSLEKLETLPALKWAVIALNFAFISAVLSISSAVLLRALDDSVTEHQAVGESLAAERARLAASNADLAHEIAERAQAEQRAQRLAQAVEQAHDVVLVSEPDGRVIYANPAFSAVFSRMRGAVAIERLQDLPAREGGAEAIDAALRDGRSWSGAVVLTSTDGRERELEAVISPIRDAAGALTSAVAVLRDVTQERELEARLRQSHKLDALGTLAGGIAHDFNNIIGSILAVAESLRADLARSAHAEDVEQIVVACDRARDIVGQMMTFSRRPAVERRPRRLAGLVAEAASLLRAAMPASIEVKLTLDADAASAIHPSEVHQILSNLATNARHAMSAPGTLAITLDALRPDDDYCRTRPRLHVGADYLRLEVSDTGSGIAADDLERIFDPFFTTKEAGEGTGLGLATVHGIITSLDGDIEVDSELGVGTTFRIFLPALAPLDEPTGAPDPAPRLVAAVAPPVARGRVLFVDDETVIRTIARRILSGLGYVVTVASDGVSAMAFFNDAPDAFDAVVTDLTMPGASGVDLIRHVRARRPDLPVILTSGFSQAAGPDVLDSLELTAYLQKPYSHKELVACLEGVFAT